MAGLTPHMRVIRFGPYEKHSLIFKRLLVRTKEINFVRKERRIIMGPIIDSLASGFPWLVFYLLVVTVIYISGLFIYVKLTPIKELELIENGNVAAAITFSALVIGLALPLAACLINKFSLIDVAAWGTLSLFLQLFLFRMTDTFFSSMSKRIEANEIAPSLVLAAFKIAGSIMLAFAIAG